MTLGGQTVAFVTVSRSGDPGYLGLVDESRSAAQVSGGRFRQLTAAEQVEAGTDVASEVWKYTGPPDAHALAVKSTGELIYDGTDNPQLPAEPDSTTFSIYGPIAPKYNMDGSVHHVTILAKRWVG
jgi:hypothetical protein